MPEVEVPHTEEVSDMMYADDIPTILTSNRYPETALVQWVLVKVWWWVQKSQIRYVSGEARHGQGIVETRSIVINNAVNGRGPPMELVTAKEWEGRAFATLIAKLYKNG
ncbi:hypothetical protein Tco_0577908 [Tanacetum coccineum]